VLPFAETNARWQAAIFATLSIVLISLPQLAATEYHQPLANICLGHF
jgi:hypothetical protein